MNTIHFTLTGSPAELMPVLDGRTLLDRVTEFETSQSYDLAGGYGGLIPEYFNYGPLLDHFLANEVRYVLACSCGEVGCWPLLCRIRLEGDHVIWDRFEQRHRPARDYSSFGPFVFALAQYRAAVQNLAEDLQTRQAV